MSTNLTKNQKCVDRNHSVRYNSINEIINDVSNIMENEEKKTSSNTNIKLKSDIIDNNGLNESLIYLIILEKRRN